MMAPSPATTPMDGANALLEGVRGAAGPSMALATNNQMGTISLGTLIQYINQRTYSDLLNLAEILPRKSDMEKKIDIVQFAQRTRQLYVRLLALVKWAASASKVDKCCHIMNFLEKQNSLLTDTADKLFHMTREDLVQARLPHFHIPAAVQTLTTGSYDRLPLSIRQKIMPSEPMSAADKRATLTRLEQVIRHRLVTATLPPQMRTTKVENGRVVLTVDQEFEAHLTVMSDSSNDTWRLLKVHILVEDRETGNGKELVHPMQVWYLTQVLQSRLVGHPTPLQELYTVLHAFCLSLQLEVLYAQTLKLLDERLDNHIRIEEYRQGSSLSLTYWRELSSSSGSSAVVTSVGGLATKTGIGYRLTVQIDSTDHSKPLHLLHTPAMPQKECEVAERAIRSEHLSMERLLVHTIYLRTKSRLHQLKQTLDEKLNLTTDKCEVGGSPAVLQVPLLQPCLRSEKLLITVDTHTGVLTPHIPQHPGCHLMADVSAALNNAQLTAKLPDLISELRYWLVCRRTEKSLQHLAATVHERLPLMYDTTHPLNALAKHKVFVTFHRHPNYVLIVEVKEQEEQSLYLLLVREASIEDDPNDPTVQTALPRSYMRAYRLMPLDSFLCSHGPHTTVDACDAPASNSVTASGAAVSGTLAVTGSKRRRDAVGIVEPASKRIKVPAYFMPDVVQCVALCDQLCPLAHINSQLVKAGVRSGGVQVEDGGVGLVVRVVGLPPTPGLSSTTQTALTKSLLCFAVRVQVPQFRGVKAVVAEYIFTGVPFNTTKESNSSNRRNVVSVHEMSSNGVYASNCVETMVAEYHAIARLFELVQKFAQRFNSPSTQESGGFGQGCGHGSVCPPLSEMVRVRSYNYKQISISYGPGYSAFCIVKYNTQEKGFTVDFGCEGSCSSATNPHSMMRPQLQEEVAAAGCDGLVRLSCLLHTSYQPCLALAKLQPTLHPGVLEKRHQAYPVEVFSVVSHSGCSARIIYRNVSCIAVQMLPGGLVAIRDGAFSAFDNSRIIDEFLPIQGLKAFLSKYVDESALSRRRSQSEDDNPPTPVPLEDSPWPVPTKPASPARHGPNTPPVSSNPHTPASPHPVASSFSASPAGGGFASPPSLPGMNPSPAGGHMSHPSPGAFPAASPSGGSLQHSVASPGFLTVPSPAGALGGLSSLQSPATTYLQGGGGLQVSRVLPNKTYAAAIPTLLTHHALHSLCSPPPQADESVGSACVLEQFLGSTYLRRHLHQASKSNNETPSSDGGSVLFKTDSLSVCVTLVSSPINCLTLKLQPLPEIDRWTQEELQVLEKFFSSKVACAPYKPNAMTAFHQILRFPFKILKECVRIMQLELVGGGQAGAKWLVQWCLTVPPIGHQLVPPGAMGVIISKNKILFFLQLSRASSSTENDSTGGVIVPVVHDINTNKTQMAKQQQQQATATEPSIRLSHAINELMARPVLPNHESSVFLCVRELLMHLNIGPDGMPYPPTSQTPTQPPSLATPTSSAAAQIASPHSMSPHGMPSPHPATASSASSSGGHYSPASSGHMQSSVNPTMGQSPSMAGMGQSATMGQASAMGTAGSMSQAGSMGQTGTMGQASSISQNVAMGQAGTMGQTGVMGQPSNMGQSGSMSQGTNMGQGSGMGQVNTMGGGAMGQSSTMGQGNTMGQGGVVGPGMGMQGPRGMQPSMRGMGGMSQGMQPNMPGAAGGMPGSYPGNMYR